MKSSRSLKSWRSLDSSESGSARSHGRGDQVMERLHSAKFSFRDSLSGSWRCIKPCAVDGDFVAPIPRAKKERDQKKDKKDRKDPNIDPSLFFKSSPRVSTKEDPKDVNFTKGNDVPTVPKEVLKDLVFIKEVPQPMAREDHLLLEDELWLKEGDAKKNGKEDRKSHHDKINGQATPPKDGKELKSQSKSVGTLDGKDGLPATESFNQSEAVKNVTMSDENAMKETQDSQAHQGKINGAILSNAQEDPNESELPTVDLGSSEKKDGTLSQTGLAANETFEDAEQVDKFVGEEDGQKEDSLSQVAKMNGESPDGEDGGELKGAGGNVDTLEERDASSLNRDKHLVLPEEPQSELNESLQSETHSAPVKESLKAEGLEGLDPDHDTTATHVGAQAKVPTQEFLKQFSKDPEAGEGGKSIENLIQYWEVVQSDGKFQRSGSQLESPTASNTTDSRPRGQAGAEQLESPAQVSKQSADSNTTAQNTALNSVGEKLQGGLTHQGSVEDPEECFPNAENLEEFLAKNGYKKRASAHSRHDQGHAGHESMWERVDTHGDGEAHSGHQFSDHSHHSGHSHHAHPPHRTGSESSHQNGLPEADGGEAAAEKPEEHGWRFGVLSVPHVLVVGALTALSVLGKAAS